MSAKVQSAASCNKRAAPNKRSALNYKRPRSPRCALFRKMEKDGATSQGAAAQPTAPPAQAERSPRGKPRGKRRSEENKQSCTLHYLIVVVSSKFLIFN